MRWISSMKSTSPSLERGQHRREVAGVLDGRPAGDAQRRAQLGATIIAKRGLAQPGRSRTAARGPGARPRPARGLEHQRQLLAHPPWPTNSLSRRGTQRALRRPARRRRRRRPPTEVDRSATGRRRGSTFTPAGPAPQRRPQHGRDVGTARVRPSRDHDLDRRRRPVGPTSRARRAPRPPGRASAAADRRGTAGARRARARGRADRRAEPVRQLEHDALRALPADAGHP